MDAPTKPKRLSATYPLALLFFLGIGALIALARPQGDSNFVSAHDRARNAQVLLDEGGSKEAPPAAEEMRPDDASEPTPAGALGAAPLCLTATPASIGTQFPCTTRVTQYNSHEFWRWTKDEEERKRRILAPLLQYCNSIDLSSTNPQERPTTSLQVVGCTGYSGMWTRCWIVAMTNATQDATENSVPTCKAGDHYDVMLESNTSKVGVERVIDLDNGMYEMQFYIRKRGSYRFTIDKMMLHQVMPKGHNSLRLTMDNDSMIGFVKTQRWSDKPLPFVSVPPTPAWPKFTESFSGDYDHGVDVVPIPQRCDEVNDVDRFRFGGWARLGRCDGIHCTGSLQSRASLEGWLWVSDVCILHVHSVPEMMTLLAEAWIVGWGGSTMKQPLSNFVEYYLQKPIFKVFMAHLDVYKKSRKRPSFFSYRQWDVAPFPTTRVTMQWGGCPNLMAGPTGCTTQVGLGYWAKIEGLIGSPPPSDPKGVIPKYPSALLLDMTVWRWPPSDDAAFLKTVDTLMGQINRNVADKKRTRPLVVWHTTPMGGNSDRGFRPSGAPMGMLSLNRNFNWVHEDYMMEHHRNNVVLISRHLMTLPLHFGNDFVHFGLHYGASEGMCNTGHSRKGYEFALCVCKTWGDDAVIISWLNAFAEYRKNVLNVS